MMASSLLLAASCLLPYHLVLRSRPWEAQGGHWPEGSGAPMSQRQQRAARVGRRMATRLAVLPLALWAYLYIRHLSQVLCDLRQLTLPLLTSGSASEHQDRTNSQEQGSHAQNRAQCAARTINDRYSLTTPVPPNTRPHVPPCPTQPHDPPPLCVCQAERARQRGQDQGRSLLLNFRAMPGAQRSGPAAGAQASPPASGGHRLLIF